MCSEALPIGTKTARGGSRPAAVAFGERRAAAPGGGRRRGTFRLSLVVPVFNEQESLPAFLDRVVGVAGGVTADYEVVCVNDGSRDRTLDLLLAAHAANPRIKVIDLSRNFGKETALTAGIDFATGDALVPLDADLQDPPEVIPELVARWREGHDMVVAVRRDRSTDTLLKRGSANAFYRLIRRVAEMPIPANAGDFRLMDRRVIEALKLMPERARFMKGMFAWLGFRQTIVTYSRPRRVAGTSKWRFWRLWNFALNGIFSFTTLPLRIWTYVGLAIALAALAYMLFIVAHTLIYGSEVPGYTSIITVMLFFSGMNMIGMGVLGEYLGRVFIEVKQRPLYLVRDAIGFETPPGREAQPGGSAAYGGRTR